MELFLFFLASNVFEKHLIQRIPNTQPAKKVITENTSRDTVSTGMSTPASETSDRNKSFEIYYRHDLDELFLLYTEHAYTYLPELGYIYRSSL